MTPRSDDGASCASNAGAEAKLEHRDASKPVFMSGREVEGEVAQELHTGACADEGTQSPRSPRATAWDTRRAKYGDCGHNGYVRGRRSTLERGALRLIAKLHAEEVLSEGQCCKALDLDRVTFRSICDEFNRSGDTVGERILIARHAAEMTQEQVAARSGVTRPQVANIEGGRCDVPVKTLQRIAAALGVSAGSLLPDQPVSPSETVAAQVPDAVPGRKNHLDEQS